MRGADGNFIEVDKNGRPVITKGPGGKRFIKGANGEMLECDENGRVIKGGVKIKNGNEF